MYHTVTNPLTTPTHPWLPLPPPPVPPQVKEKVPVDAKVVVGCQKGLRSLAACEQLSRSGYSTVSMYGGAWCFELP